jgi:acetyl-CoA carboxylase carboxyl transferase subunit alpha
MKITARDLLDLGVIDEIIPEPSGGAHRDPALAARTVGEAIERHLSELEGLSGEELVRGRLAKFMAMGEYREA